MSNKQYKEVKGLNLPAIDKAVRDFWATDNTFQKSIDTRKDANPFVFFEGPPSANGLPGIHHVMGRTIKDLFCRYKTLKGYKVERKGGWDTHGLPVELGVEKKLGITKEDIGKTISIKDYNAECRTEVMKYKDVWDDLTQKMGYWVDLDNPYMTFDNEYIESVWALLKRLFEKDLLYKGYTVQPFSPAAGTGLSSHELNLPGCYRDVKDTSVVAQFKVVKDEVSKELYPAESHGDLFFVAWTTTPWTLPSNCALAVGKNITYVQVKTYNQYTFEPITVIMAEDLLGKFFSEKNKELALSDYSKGDKKIPFEVGQSCKGSDLEGCHYAQLLPYVQPNEGDAFRVILGDFVTTEDGTGIVHTASVFGADDFRVCQANNVPSIMVQDENGKDQPLVNRQGRFVAEVTDFANMAVKPDYEPEEVRNADGFLPTDVRIAIKLKEENRAFKVEKYEHSYPHCWRTDKPVLYYPLDSWFVRTTQLKDRLVELNTTINWKPEATGSGRFGKWLENLVDWNLSRSRYWGTPLPLWRTEDGSETLCIGSMEELHQAMDASVASGYMTADAVTELKTKPDLHRPYVDDIVLCAKNGEKMFREPDLIDVWFDSGAMPYAQHHYPFEHKEKIEQNEHFPADFIAEGVDQTRGWFFTLHAIATLLFDSVAFKNVVSNGLVLDSKGNKMSKRLGNGVDPFETLDTHGADAVRWYMMVNSQPWDNLKFDVDGITDTKRKFFGTLYNTYSFFALYANIDSFTYSEDEIPVADRPELDQWIISLLNTLVKDVDTFYAAFEPTKAARAIQLFVTDHLSNWYVRLSRRKFWKGAYDTEKIAAYQSLYKCLEVVSQLMSPIAPFFSEWLYRNINECSNRNEAHSVHLSAFPSIDESVIDADLEERMQMAQDFSSMLLSLRKKENIKVRQPLNKALVPVLSDKFKAQVQAIEPLILSETNIKALEYVDDASGIIVKSIKPDFKKLGPKFGKQMKAIAAVINQFGADEITTLEIQGFIEVDLNGTPAQVTLDEVNINSEDIPGWLVASQNGLTIALDITLTDDLKAEGDAREIVNKIQRLRKDAGFEVTDRINVTLEQQDQFDGAIQQFKDYICSETLASSFKLTPTIESTDILEINDVNLRVLIEKV